MLNVSTGRQHGAALLLLAVATLSCFHKLACHPGEVLVGPQNRGNNDLVSYFIPSHEFAARSLQDSGELPFWNPYICLGLPYTGNPQSALYYPPNWLCYIWPAGLILSWLLVAHHLFAGAGVYFLARRHGLGWSGSVIGGIIFLGAPFLVAQSAEGHYAQICAIAWTPWAFLAYESVREGRRGGAAILALCLAMSFFCGHAQETYYLALLLSGFAVFDALQRMRNGDEGAARLLGNWVLAGLFTVGIVAVDLVPIFINSRMTLRTSLANLEGDFGWSAFHLANLQQLLTPFALSRPELWQPGAPQFWETVCYFGIIPLVLAASGAAAGRSRPLACRMAAMWLVTFLFALGTNGPIFKELSSVVPGLSWFRLPSRMLFFMSFATAMLAAVGVDSTLQRHSVQRIRVLVLYLVIAVVLAIGWGALTVWQTGVIPVLPGIPRLVTAALLTPALLALTAAAFRRGGSVIFVSGLILSSVLELSLFSHQVTETAQIASLGQRDTELLKLITDESEPPPRILALQDIVSDQDACRYGLHKLRGYEPAGPAGYLLLVNAISNTDGAVIDPMGFEPARLSSFNPQLLDLLNVGCAVQSFPAGAVATIPEGWKTVHSGLVVERTRLRRDDARTMRYRYQVLKNESVLPRAFVVGTARELDSWSEFTAAAPRIDFRREVVLAKDVLPAGGPRSDFRPARITAYSANHIEVQAQLDAPGYLVLSDLWFPGWKVATADGPLPVLRANMTLRAVPLPAGVHHLRWTFRPPGLIPGAMLTVFTLLVLTVTFVLQLSAYGDSTSAMACASVV